MEETTEEKTEETAEAPSGGEMRRDKNRYNDNSSSIIATKNKILGR